MPTLPSKESLRFAIITGFLSVSLSFIATTAAIPARAQSGPVLNNTKITELVHGGLGEQSLIARIQKYKCDCDISGTAIAKLRALRVPEKVILAMKKNSDRSRRSSTGIDLVWVPPGETQVLIRGIQVEDVKDGFYAAKYEVTQEQWSRIMGATFDSRQIRNKPGIDQLFFCPKCPVFSINFLSALSFVERLNALDRDFHYTIPTESEWLFLAHDMPEMFDKETEYGWRPANSGGRPRPVGQLAPNSRGLYDLLGNVFEWTSTSCGRMDFAPQSPVSHRELSECKVVLGDSWGFYSIGTGPVGWRGRLEQAQDDYKLGFRVIARFRV